MNVELKKNSWHRNLYEFWWIKSAPNNLCNYFWQLILAVVMLIPLMAGRIVFDMTDDDPEIYGISIKSFLYTVITAMVIFVSGLLGWGIAEVIMEPISILFIIGGLVGIGLIIIIAFGIGYFFSESEVMKITTSYISAKKNKICPIINWKE